MSRLHVLIIGPGLGRDDHMQSCAKLAFELAKDMEQMGVVVDADGLWLVQVGRALFRDGAQERYADGHSRMSPR